LAHSTFKTEERPSQTTDMKKVIAVTILTISIYSAPYSSACKYGNETKIYKYQNRENKTPSPLQADDETDFHPLIFVTIPFN